MVSEKIQETPGHALSSHISAAYESAARAYNASLLPHQPKISWQEAQNMAIEHIRQKWDIYSWVLDEEDGASAVPAYTAEGAAEGDAYKNKDEYLSSLMETPADNAVIIALQHVLNLAVDVKAFTQKHYTLDDPHKPTFIPYSFNPNPITYTIKERFENTASSAAARLPGNWPLLRAFTNAFGSWESTAKPPAPDGSDLLRLFGYDESPAFAPPSGDEKDGQNDESPSPAAAPPSSVKHGGLLNFGSLSPLYPTTI